MFVLALVLSGRAYCLAQSGGRLRASLTNASAAPEAPPLGAQTKRRVAFPGLGGLAAAARRAVQLAQRSASVAVASYNSERACVKLVNLISGSLRNLLLSRAWQFKSRTDDLIRVGLW